MVQALERVSLGDITSETLSAYMNILFEHHLATYFDNEEKYLQESYTDDIQAWARSSQVRRLSQSASLDLLDLLNKSLALKKTFWVSVKLIEFYQMGPI
jgi:predicted SAM-dependent methyltransferase